MPGVPFAVVPLLPPPGVINAGRIQDRKLVIFQVDGLPGAKGVGEKTAADLLRRHGSLETAIEHALRESPRVRAALHGQAEELAAFKDIATLRRVELQRPPDTPLDRTAAAAAARARGMNRLAERLEDQSAA